MKTFDVYKHSTHGYEAVKKGFSWPGFLFTVIWAFVKKMWGLGAALFGVLVLIVIGQEIFVDAGAPGLALALQLVLLGIWIYIGVKGNDWRRTNLQRRGFEKLRTVQNSTPDAAISEVVESSKVKKVE